MRCFECSIADQSTDAVGVCHYCSVGLCTEHAVLTLDAILIHQPVAKVIELPKKARTLLCRTCLEALRQNHAIEEQRPASATLAER